MSRFALRGRTFRGKVEDLWSAGSSVLIYQSFRREPRQVFAERLAEELRARTDSRFVEAFQTPHALFLLAAQERHADPFRDAIASLPECGKVKSPPWDDSRNDSAAAQSRDS